MRFVFLVIILSVVWFLGIVVFVFSGLSVKELLEYLFYGYEIIIQIDKFKVGLVLNVQWLWIYCYYVSIGEVEFIGWWYVLMGVEMLECDIKGCFSMCKILIGFYKIDFLN